MQYSSDGIDTWINASNPGTNRGITDRRTIPPHQCSAGLTPGLGWAGLGWAGLLDPP